MIKLSLRPLQVRIFKYLPMTDNSIDGVNFLKKNPLLATNTNKSTGVYLQISTEDIVDPNFSYPIVTCQSGKSFRGECLLINQRDFHPSTKQMKRDGTDVDANRVERVFKSLNYRVTRILNASLEVLQQALIEASQADHSGYDSFVFVMLSHGENNVVYATDGSVSTSSIIDFFRGDRCRSLLTKPKLFFFQACRGINFDTGVSTMVTDASEDIIVHKLPIEADILVAYSTTPGYFAWRNSSCGSWFIQELCNALERNRDSKKPEDLLSLLTVVARLVAYQYRSKTGVVESDNMKQMTSTVSTLTCKVYLTGRPT